MLQDLKLGKEYDGLLYLAESIRNLPKLMTHHHVELELNLVVKGTITYVVEGKSYTFHPRTLLWLFPEQEHQQVDRSDDAQNFVVVFKPTLIARSCRTEAYAGLKRTRNEHDGVLNTLLKPDSFDLVYKTLDSLMQGSLDADLLNSEAGFGAKSGFSFAHGDPDGLNAGLHHLLLLSWRIQRTGNALGEGVTLHPSVERAIKTLSSGDWPHDLARLARKCGVSESHLSRLFRQQIGVSLSRYRNSLRLSRFWKRTGARLKRT